jgi:hypothetical protein
MDRKIARKRHFYVPRKRSRNAALLASGTIIVGYGRTNMNLNYELNVGVNPIKDGQNGLVRSLWITLSADKDGQAGQTRGTQ